MEFKGWKPLDYWKKGAIIGFIFGIFIILLMFQEENLPDFMTIVLFWFYFIPHYFGGLLAKNFGLYEIGAAITIFPSIILFYAIIGTLIGLIIQKIKKGK